MEYHNPPSTCRICGSEYSRKGMTRHIRSCLKKELKNRPSVRSSNLIHLHVIDAHDPEYFLHLLVSGSTLLNELDTYLRSIWLECCGHMSAFMDPRYHDDMDMSATIKTAFANNSTLEYQYDFGSTTELSVSKLDIYSGTSDITEKINLLARNTEPLVPCDECEGRKATQICCECQWDGGGWLCDDCAPDHECGEEMFLPVVNSPRAGVCGYEGGRTELDSPQALFKDRSTKSRRQQPKKGQSATGKRPTAQTNSSTENLKMVRTAVIGEMIRDFADQHLSEELEGYALKLTDTLSRTDTLNIARGKTEIWAAAIVYVIARLNFLFDRDHEDHIAADTICDFFNTKKATVGNKATLIEDACGLVLGDEEYCSRDISELLTLVQSPSSLFFPESMFPDIDLPSAADMSEIQELSLLRDSIEQLKADLPKHLRKDFSLIIEPVISEIAAEFGLEIPILKKVMRELGIEIDEVDMPDSFEPDRKGGRKAEIIELDEFRAEKEKERQAANRQKQGEEQQKITDAEKSKIDSGQLSIFDDDE